MNDSILTVRMLGELSLTWGDKTISEGQNRTRKMWTLMAYLLYHRHRIVSRDELLELLWGNGAGHNPVSAMKTALHRTRALLNDLYPNAGHELILQKGNGYYWNNSIPMDLDIENFQALCQNKEPHAEEQIDQWLKALDLYQGNFLTSMSSELWVLPVSAYYHKLYVQTVQKVIPHLEKQGQSEQVSILCQNALQIDPYNEEFYRHLMRARIDQGNQNDAMAIYEELSRRLSSDFGIIPEEKTRQLYREAMQTIGEQYLPMELVQLQLKEEEGASGAMICDYITFKMICFAQSRAMSRVEMDTQVALFTVTDSQGKALSKQEKERAMKQLEHEIQSGLRRGDVLSKCSGSQHIVLLPYANYENSCKVCERIIQSFIQNHPQSPAAIRYMVHGLEPYA